MAVCKFPAPFYFLKKQTYGVPEAVSANGPGMSWPPKETLMRHPKVKSLFFLNHQRAMQLSQLSQQTSKELVLLTQPPLESLCPWAERSIRLGLHSHSFG
jgi:hypothetical protein